MNTQRGHRRYLESCQEGRREVCLGVCDWVSASCPVGQCGSPTSYMRGVMDLGEEERVGGRGGVEVPQWNMSTNCNVG